MVRSGELIYVTRVNSITVIVPIFALSLQCLFSHKVMLSLPCFTLIIVTISYFRSDGALTCFTMRFFYVLFGGTLIPFTSSSPYGDELWGFDDTSFLPESWYFDDSSSFSESGLSSLSESDSSSLFESDPESELTSSMFMTYNGGDLATDTEVPADNDLFDGEDSPSWDEFHPDDDVVSMSGSDLDDVSLDLSADCGNWFQINGKRRKKRAGESCTNPPTNTEKMPDGTGPSAPSPGGASFFPGYGKYVMDKKTNILRIPAYVPRFPGETDVCLIYTEGYLPYGVCGTELFNSVETFWGIETYTITKAQLGMSPSPGAADDVPYCVLSQMNYLTK